MAEELLELSLVQEKAIRSYLKKIVIPLAGVVGAFSFLFGFMISQISNIAANAKIEEMGTKASEKVEKVFHDTQQRYLSMLEDMHSEQTLFNKKIFSEQYKAQETLININKLSTDAEILNKKVIQLKSIENLDNIEKGITLALKEDSEFIANVSGDIGQRVELINSQTQSLDSKFESQIISIRKDLSSLRKSIGILNSCEFCFEDKSFRNSNSCVSFNQWTNWSNDGRNTGDGTPKRFKLKCE